MGNEFLDKVEGNAAVRVWSEKTQLEKSDSLMEGKVDLVPTIEEYTTLLRCPRTQTDKIYLRAANVPTFLKKLMNITGMSEQWITTRIKKIADCKCIHWRNLRDLILAHLDTKKRADIFALSVYSSVVFPKALGSFCACRKTGEGRFIECAQLLLAWFHSQFWKVEKVSYRIFSEDYYPLKELVATPRRDVISEENWIAILQNLRDEDVE
ncbi:hypothetical protein Gohar_028349 [Gossypium harknessii]|uniref:Uncharacterized protein n=1 Tax=Gossypium harknessii TaxID=34285 RepID=A0A7J9IAN7_9ROSI|nr:hypothetical protein [Gossypium harknessii]